jgi:hypothetical protein
MQQIIRHIETIIMNETVSLDLVKKCSFAIGVWYRYDIAILTDSQSFTVSSQSRQCIAQSHIPQPFLSALIRTFSLHLRRAPVHPEEEADTYVYVLCTNYDAT